jgi:streptogramin lyase/alpha-tubulin suppressor-like RCC1 family protein
MSNRIAATPACLRAVVLIVAALAGCSAVRAQAILEFTVPTAASGPQGIASGPDGTLWFTENTGNKIGRITTAGAFTEFVLPTVNGQPKAITLGPDGALWFTGTGNLIGRIPATASSGADITEIFLNAGDNQPFGIAAAADGNLWFTEFNSNKIGKITPAGDITEFPLPVAGGQPALITAGPDGALWFTQFSGNKIGRIPLNATPALPLITEFPLPTATSRPLGITAGPDGALWFTEQNGNRIGRITTTGSITEFNVPTAASQPTGITAGPDGALWFTELVGNRIGRIPVTATPASPQITEFPLPTASSGPSLITGGTDRAVWFAESSGNRIGRIQPPPVPTTTVAGSTANPSAFSQEVKFTALVIGANGAPTGNVTLSSSINGAVATNPLSALRAGYSLSTGNGHTCALPSSGGVKCWGENGDGQLGNGNIPTDSPIPMNVSGLAGGVLAVSAGGLHSCALTGAGGVKCWGNNLNGQLGDSTKTNRSVPVDAIGLGSGVIAVATGDHHTCALTNGGRIKCWGLNGNGQLGNGTTSDSSVPVDVLISAEGAVLTGVTAIAAGGLHTCALVGSGGLMCWGADSSQQLGDGPGSSNHSVPVNVSGLASGVAAVTAGSAHTCALTTAGGLKCWGQNNNGQVGNGTSGGNVNAPVDVNGLASGVVAVAAGQAFTCALTSAGGAKCWGSNTLGQLVDGDPGSASNNPVDVTGVTAGSIAIAAGGAHTCAQTDAAIRCWGRNFAGQLGNGRSGGSADSSVPVGVPGFTALAVAKASFATSALALGTHAFTANYAGDAGHAASAGNLTEVITPPTTATHNFDGDGRSDIAWRQTSSPPGAIGDSAIWLLNGTQILQAASLGTVPTDWTIVGQRDFDGDRKHDWLWRQDIGTVAIWLLNGVQIAQTGVLGTVPIDWSISGTADFNGDGKGDILWRDTNGTVAIWLLSGLQILQSAALGTVPTTWAIAAAGDFNGDGMADILWRDSSTGAVAIWLIGGLRILQTGSLATVPLSWVINGIGDFNGDGKWDILWRDNSTGAVAIWLLNGLVVSQSGGLGSVGPEWVIVETGDFNGDGKSDLLWRNTNSGAIAIWFLNGLQVASAAGTGAVGLEWTIQELNAD